MRVHPLPDPASFLAAAGTFLAEREALHNLPLGVAEACRRDPTRYPGRNWFAMVQEDDGRPAGVALMTPPHRLLYFAPPGAAGVVAAELEAHGYALPGVHGPTDAAEAFASLWCGRHGLRPRADRDLRAFELTAVIPAPPAPGGMRRAGPGDAEIAAAWYRAFHEETGAMMGDLSPEDQGRRAVREERLFLWEDGEPVAQAVDGGSTPNGSRVGAVYTPPGRRRRGYATALVAALSRHLLDGGKRTCFLFTDLANPISNSIYPKIGYRPVADFRDIDFVA
jgi:hypothetical protein